jgi:GT2 family glycosyltransferase
MNVFVIIVTYKGHKWYERCFNSLRTSETPITTVVVDNASCDGTIEYIDSNFPEIILIKSDENLGFGQGNNLGIRYALDNGADYVLLLNQDAWIEQNSIGGLIKISKNNPDYGILGPMLLNATRDSISTKFEEYFKGIQDVLFTEDLYFGKVKEVYPINMLPAAAWLIPKNILLKVGGFDPIFYHYGEDDHYVQRVKYFGYKIGFCPQIKVVHDSENIMLEGKIKFITNSAIIRRVLLLAWVDVNTDFTPGLIAKKYVFNILKQLFLLRFSKTAIAFKDLMYLLKNKHEIIKSREIAKNTQRAWLIN